MLQKGSGCVGIMLIKGLHKTPAGVFIDRRVLVEFLPFGFVNQTDCRNADLLQDSREADASV